MRVLAVIVARGGSKRIKNKNMKELDGKPLIHWAIDAIKDSKLITDAVISTDSDEYGAYAERHGIIYIKRPKKYALDNSDIAEATKHALSVHGVFDYVITLQAAVPLRPSGAIDALLMEMERNKAKGGLSMIKRSPWMRYIAGKKASSWWNTDSYPRTQEIDWNYYEEVNAIQIARREVVQEGRRWDYPLAVVELPQWCSVDIDNEEDLVEANEYVHSLRDLLNKSREYKTFTVTSNGR